MHGERWRKRRISQQRFSGGLTLYGTMCWYGLQCFGITVSIYIIQVLLRDGIAVLFEKIIFILS